MNAALLSRLPLPFRKAKQAETEFWPALPDESLSVTDKLAALPPDIEPAVAPVPAGFPRQFLQDPKTLMRVRDKLRELTAQARAEQFAADLSLPVFGPLALDFGCLTADTAPVRPGDGTEPAPDPMAAAKALYRDAWVLDQPEGTAWEAVAKAADVLYDALDTYRDIDRGELHWEREYPDLKDEADPEAAALAKAAEEVTAAADDLRSAMSAHREAGTEAKATSAGSDQ